MLTNLTNKKTTLSKTIVNKRSLRMLYRPYLSREAVTRGLLEVSLRKWLSKTLTDSSSGPSEVGCRDLAAKASFHNRYR